MPQPHWFRSFTVSPIAHVVLVTSVLLSIGGCYGTGESGPIRPATAGGQPAVAEQNKVVTEQNKAVAQQDKAVAQQVPANHRTFTSIYSQDITRINVKAMQTILDLQAEGKQSIDGMEYANLSKDDSPRLYSQVVDTIYSNRREYRAYLPTTATQPIGFPENEISPIPRCESDSVELWGDFLSIGTDHFAKQRLEGISAADQAKVKDWIAAVYQDYVEEKLGNDWDRRMTEYEQFAKLGKGLRKDPLFLSAKALILIHQRKIKQADDLYDRIFISFSLSDYPSRIPAYLHVECCVTGVRQNEAYIQRLANCSEAIRHWISKDFRAEPKHYYHVEQTVNRFIGRLVKVIDKKMIDRIDAAITRNIDLPETLRLIMRGDIAFQLGWMARGSGFASEVSSRQWELFNQYLETAATHYKKVMKANPADAGTAVKLAEIAKTGQIEESVDEWLAVAIKQEPELLEAYTKKLFGLLPQWGGSVQKMIDFSVANSKTEDASSLRPLLILQCFQYIRRNASVESTDTRRSFEQDPQLLKRAIEVCDQLSKRSMVRYAGRYRERDYFQTLKLIFAASLSDFEAISAAEEELQNQPNAEAFLAFGDRRFTFERFLSRSMAYSEKYKEDALKVESIFEMPIEERLKRIRVVESIHDRIQSDADSSPSVVKFFDTAVKRLRLEETFQKGDTIKLAFEPGFPGLQFVDARQITSTDKHSITIDNRKHTFDYYVETEAQFFGPKEISFQIELPVTEFLPDRVSGRGTEFLPAVITHYFPFRDGQSPLTVGLAKGGTRKHDKTTMSFQMAGREFQAGLFYFHQTFYFVVDDTQAKHDIRLITDDHYLEVYFDGEFLGRTDTPFGKDQNRITKTLPNFRIHQFSPRGGQGVATFSNIEIRKGMPAPPFKGAPEKLLKHYQDRLAMDKDDPWNHFWLGAAQQENGDHQAAIESYQKALKLNISEPSRVNFWLGDAYDHLGKYDLAIKHYAETSNRPVSVNEMAISERVFGPYSNYHNWARFRHSWLKMNFQGERGYAYTRSMQIPNECKVLEHLLNMQSAAYNGKFSHTRHLDRALQVASPELEEELVKRKKAFEAKEPYRETGEPLYRKFEKYFPRFRSLADITQPIR